LLRDAGRGSIVNMASEVAFSGSPGLAHYDASKAALAPGFIPTEASARLSGAGLLH
jgi:short-subunit dehydrogenase